MRKHSKHWSALVAVFVTLAIGVTAFGRPADRGKGQPKGPEERQEAREERQEAREERQEAREERQEERQERREERREAVKESLTPEQKQKIEEYKAKLQEKRKEFHGKVQELAGLPPEKRREEIRKLVEEARGHWKEALGEAGAKMKAKGEELRLEWQAKKKRYEELKDKEKAGTLTPEEKDELAKMQEKVDKAKKAKEDLKKAFEKGAAAIKQAIGPHKDEIIKAWGHWILANETAQSELNKHAKRMAQLTAAKQVAEAEGRDELAAHIDELIKVETKRHEEAMKLLQSKEGK
jgi:hypothetical protein